MQTIYGVSGERRLDEHEIPWLSGYENSRPVRIGNAASNQFQLDVYGEVLAAAWQGHLAGIKMTEPDWALMVSIMKFLESHWQKPDEGIWEVRGGRQQFTHSKMMAWLAFDRAIKMVENCECAAFEHFGRWQKIREHRTAMNASGEFAARRRQQQVKWMWSMLEQRMMARLRADPSVRSKVKKVEAEVADGRVTPALAAEQIAGMLR